MASMIRLAEGAEADEQSYPLIAKRSSATVDGGDFTVHIRRRSTVASTLKPFDGLDVGGYSPLPGKDSFGGVLDYGDELRRRRRFNGGEFLNGTPLVSPRWWVALGVITLAIVFLSGFSLSHWVAQPNASSRPPTAGRQVVIRMGGLTHEGIGSSVQHFKHSIVLAELLDRDLLLSHLLSEHNYSSSLTFNTAAAREGAALQIPICVVGDMIGREELASLMTSACEKPELWEVSRHRIANVFAGCGSMVHNVNYELYETLNGCTAPWLKRVMLGPVCGRSSAPPPTPTTLRIGIHVRWGDVAPLDTLDVDPTRGISFNDINGVVASLQQCGQPVRIRVYAEGLPPAARSKLNFIHELVDSGDDVKDLCSLSDNDVLVAGGSSYAVLAWQLSHARLAIIADQGFYKYDKTQSESFTPLPLSASRGMDICELLPGRESE